MNGISSHQMLEDHYFRALGVLESGNLEELKIFLQTDSFGRVDDSFAHIYRALTDGQDMLARKLAADAANMIRTLYPKFARS